MLPSVQHCLAHLESQPDTAAIPAKRLTHCSRLFLAELRQAILDGERRQELTRPLILAELHRFVQEYHQPSLRRVINASGIIIHTNLGRSLLPPELGPLLAETASAYSNLELNLKTGKRGSRYSHVEALLCELTGAEPAFPPATTYALVDGIFMHALVAYVHGDETALDDLSAQVNSLLPTLFKA